MAKMVTGKVQDIDSYLATVNPSQRKALQSLRKTIQKAAPEAVEGISYNLPAFRLLGKPLVAFSAFTNHCSFFPMSGKLIDQFQKELKGFETSKGTIRFTTDKPLPASLITRIVKARVADIESKPKPKAGRKVSDTSDEVTAFLKNLKHPLQKDYLAVQKIILNAHASISAGIKWNSLSFKTHEYFATINLRNKDAVQLVMHLGAKVKDNTKPMIIDDQQGLLQWLSSDRCLLTLGKGQALNKNKKALRNIILQWIKYV
ncbi:MAG: DUF1801 domain-containing protein [Planctomycetia bacterium]|nr:DUF1801 domain-containing protein [Planctomycetia bacterium]